MSGYLYRLPEADAALLRTTVAEVVGFPCWSFGGASTWEFDPGQGRANLRPLSLIQRSDELLVRGDFGHAFATRSEVRWKRRDQTSYDLLILSDAELQLVAAEPLGDERGVWMSSVPDQPNKVRIIQSDARLPIRFVAYHAPNGAVQFLSYRLEVQA